MSSISERIYAATSKGVNEPAILVLEDGTAFEGRSCAAPGEVFGEICFNTSMVGYLEVITDPSYAGQIVTMTYPQIGNYGVCLDDTQAQKPAAQGIVVRDMCTTPSNWRSTMSLPDYLTSKGVVAIEGVDTRALVRHIRNHGAQRAVLSTIDTDINSLLAKVKASPLLTGTNLVETVSRKGICFCERKAPLFRKRLSYPAYNVVVYDCGVKSSILDQLACASCKLTIVPWDTPVERVRELCPCGVFFSNGPGDPESVSATAEKAAQLLGTVPIFGICLGYQMLALAAGAKMEKLTYGHRGGNQPVMNLLTRRVEITAQNHGFSLLFDSLGPLVPELSGGIDKHVYDLRFWTERNIAPVVYNEKYGRIQLTHVNLNDGTPEGFRFLDVPAFCVQYHPEAAPGPTDSHYLFQAFTKLMLGRSDYLDIDVAPNRLNDWEFCEKSEVDYA